MNEEQVRLAAVMGAHAFSLYKADYRLTTTLSHKILTRDAQHDQEVKEIIKQMQENYITQLSAWASADLCGLPAP